MEPRRPGNWPKRFSKRIMSLLDKTGQHATFAGGGIDPSWQEKNNTFGACGPSLRHCGAETRAQVQAIKPFTDRRPRRGSVWGTKSAPISPECREVRR